MTARKTILALGLMWIASAAGNSALAAPAAGGGPCGEATCGGSANCDAGCATCGNATCDATCNGTDGFWLPCMQNDPVACEFRDCLKDFCDACRDCTWKADVSFFNVHRSAPGTQSVLFNPADGASLFDASRLLFGFASGPRVSVTALDCEGWGLEVNYFGIDGWSATHNIPAASLPGGGPANILVDSVTQLSLNDAQFQALSRLYSIEVNFRKPLCGNLSFLAGFRWLEMTDQYNVAGTSATTANIMSESVLTHNHMYGFQVGADGTMAREEGRWRIGGFIKGGIFLDSADQATALNDPGGLGAFAVNNNHLGAAFFGETGVLGYFEITKHVAATGGYQVMFIDSVAQPANQLTQTNLANATANVDMTSGLFYHGAAMGLEVTW